MKYLQLLAVAAAASAFPSTVFAGEIDNHAAFVPIQGTIAGLAGVANGIETRDIKNSANFIPIQATLAAASGVVNGVSTGGHEKRTDDSIKNSANFIPIQATAALLSEVENGIATGKRGIENSANFVPIQATIAGLAGIANGVATGGHEKRGDEGIKNSANFVPIQATAALLSGVENGIATGKRGIQNSANFVPIQATAALLSGVENGIATGKRDIKNSANFIPIQATAALLSDVENNISAGQDMYHEKADEMREHHHGHEHHRRLAAGYNGDATQLLGGVTGGKSSPLQSLIKRYADEYDAEMAARAISTDGRGQRPRPRGDGGEGTGMCSVGEVKCCNQVINDESKKEALAGLAGINDVLSGNIGLNCNSIPIIGATIQNQCKSSPVCCQNVTQDGLINFGCISLPIN